MDSQTLKSNVRYRIAAVLFLSRSFFSASVIAAFTVTPIVAVALSGSEAAAGIPNTVSLVGRLLFAYPLGIMMDKIGRRLALSSGFAIAFIGVLISIWAITGGLYWAFLLGAFFIGMSRTANDQSRYVGAEVFPLSQRAKVIGILIFAGTIGSVCGPLLVAPSADWVELRGYVPEVGPFAIAAIAMLLSLIILFFFLFPDPGELGKQVAKVEAAADPNSIENIEPRTLRTIFSAPRIQLALLTMALSYFVMSFVMVITPVQMNHHNHGLDMVSLVIAAHTMGMFGLSFLTGWLIDKIGQIIIIRIGALILIAACLIAPIWTTAVPLGVALFLLGLGWNFCFVAGTSLLSDGLAAGERGRAQGASEALIAVGSGTASLSVGAIFGAGGYILVNSIGLGIAILLLLLSFMLNRASKRQWQ